MISHLVLAVTLAVSVALAWGGPANAQTGGKSIANGALALAELVTLSDDSACRPRRTARRAAARSATRRSGVGVGAADVNGDGRADVVVGGRPRPPATRSGRVTPATGGTPGGVYVQ